MIKSTKGQSSESCHTGGENYVKLCENYSCFKYFLSESGRVIHLVMYTFALIDWCSCLCVPQPRPRWWLWKASVIKEPFQIRSDRIGLRVGDAVAWGWSGQSSLGTKSCNLGAPKVAQGLRRKWYFVFWAVAISAIGPYLLYCNCSVIRVRVFHSKHERGRELLREREEWRPVLNILRL